MEKFIADKKGKLSKLALNNISDLSYTALMRALRKKDVKINGKRTGVDVTLDVGDSVEIYYTVNEITRYTELFCDQNVLVINKKKGFTSEDVFLEIQSKYLSAKFIHRLDRNTDGIMIFALNESSETELLAGFKNRTFDKIYHTTVKGVFTKKQGVLTAFLLKDKDNAVVKIFDNQVKGSVPIKTGYKVLEESKGISKLEVVLYTGKTHQIRAHLAHVGHPVVGDGKYGDYALNKQMNLNTQMLTAYQLTLHFDSQSPLYYLNGKIFNLG